MASRRWSARGRRRPSRRRPGQAQPQEAAVGVALLELGVDQRQDLRQEGIEAQEAVEGGTEGLLVVGIELAEAVAGGVEKGVERAVGGLAVGAGVNHTAAKAFDLGGPEHPEGIEVIPERRRARWGRWERPGPPRRRGRRP